MWFRTALLLVLFLLAFRFLRNLLDRVASGRDTSSVAPDPRRPTTPPGPEGRPTGQTGAPWPPGEITDVSYRESSPDESGTP